MSNNSGLSRLFEPINIGTMRVNNRIVMAPMSTGFATREGLVTRRLKAYYETRAKGGPGMVIVEACCIDYPRGTHGQSRLTIDREITLQGLAELTKSIKKHGARAIIQLNHAGRVTKFKIPGFQPVAPSSIPIVSGAYPKGEIPKELSLNEISEIISFFAKSARRAQDAGFDGIEIHAAHGYLLAQFLSPFCNKRTDQYGGNLENRARLLTEVLEAVRETVGKDFPLWYRINGHEYETENGFTIEEATKVARKLNSLVNAVHVSAFSNGTTLSHLPDEAGILLPLCEAIKKVVTVPVIGVGRLTPDLAEKAIQEGKIDLAAFGRELLTDPELPNKTKMGELGEIRPCIACFHCNDVGILSGDATACSVNGFMGHEEEYNIIPAKRNKKIVIIGGGPAGMEASRILAVRGHKVVLIEKENVLGGQVNLAMALLHKRDRIGPFLKYLENQILKLGIDLKLNTEADLNLIDRLSPAEIILAAGAIPAIPPIRGSQIGILTVPEVLSGGKNTGARVIVIGGGSTGCETAEFLTEEGKNVTVIDMLPEIATNIGFRDRSRLLARIKKLPITFLTSTRCTQIEKNGLMVMTKQDSEKFLQADTIVSAAGVKPNNSLFMPLRAKGYDVHLIGDCWQPGRIADATADAVRLACSL